MKPDYRFPDPKPVIDAADVDELIVLFRRLVAALERLADRKDQKDTKP